MRWSGASSRSTGPPRRLSAPTGRPTAVAVHLLPPGAFARGAGRAHPADDLWPVLRPDRGAIPGLGEREQRLTRARRELATAGIPYQVPDADHLAERLDAVLASSTS